jgi:hypothetical protein
MDKDHEVVETAPAGGGGGGSAGAADTAADTASPSPVYVCPITLEPVEVPVCSEVGSIYEMAAFLQLADREDGSVPIDPLTGEPLSNWPAFKYAQVSKGLVNGHVAKGTVHNELRAWCKETLVQPMVFLASIQTPSALVSRAFFKCLDAAGKATGFKERCVAFREAAALLKAYDVAIPNHVMGQWLTNTPEGRRLTSQLEADKPHPFQMGWGPVLLFMCVHPSCNEHGLQEALGPSTFCYYGHFGDKLRPVEEKQAYIANRARLWRMLKLE